MTLRATLFIPTLNEAEGLRAIMPRISKSWCEQILVADGNSTDETVAIAKSFGCEVVLQSRPGIRHAYIEGFRQIRNEFVVTFSPDGNCIPELIPDLLTKLSEGYDMVVASRYAPGAVSEDDDYVTALGNWMFTKLVNRLHCGNFTDAMGIFRAYRTSLFYELGLDRENSYWSEKYFNTVIGIEPCLSVRAARAQKRIAEIPGSEPARLAGERKLQIIRWGAAYLTQIVGEALHPFGNHARTKGCLHG